MAYSRSKGFISLDEEGNALMQMKGKWDIRKYPQSLGNLALADESLNERQKPTAKTRSPRLCLVQDITQEEFEVDALAPATGIINGIRLSITLWSLIALVILLIR